MYSILPCVTGDYKPASPRFPLSTRRKSKLSSAVKPRKLQVKAWTRSRSGQPQLFPGWRDAARDNNRTEGK